MKRKPVANIILTSYPTSEEYIVTTRRSAFRAKGGWWREQDSNLRRRTSSDLQSDAFDRSAIPPSNTSEGIRDLASSVN